jgi:hypothetical protein
MSVTWNSSKQQPRLVEDRVRRQLDHVAVGDFAARDVLAIGVDLLMRLGHELVEMGAALVLHRRVLEEQVHQHGLAAANLAMHVETIRRHIALVAEQAAEQAELLRRLVAGQPLLESGERLGRLRLRRIGLDRAGGNQSLIMGVERGGLVRKHGPLSASARRKLQAVNWCWGYANSTRHTPRRRGIQHAAASRRYRRRLRILDHPPARMMTAGDCGEHLRLTHSARRNPRPHTVRRRSMHATRTARSARP